MYLQKLEFAGFKSFAHKTSLTFTRGITAIVGPNGSGKSNVADGIRWVLGEQSLKLLRGKKSEDVIFAGSDKKTRLGLAEVSLMLNNEDGQAPVDYSELEITRRVDRDGQGDYLLNRSAVRLQDIQLLLARCNFGQQTYSVIGQGMVDSFLSTSPTERKELFDDAAGVRQYQIKRTQAMQKLGHTKENLRQAQVLMDEIEPRLRSLTRSVKRLERREEVERELRTNQITLFGRRLSAVREALKKQQAFFADLDAKRQAAEQEVQAIQKELEELERSDSREERFVDLQRKYTTVLDEKNELLRDQSVLKGRLEVAATKQGSIDRVLVDQRLESIDRAASGLSQELRAIEQGIAADLRRIESREKEHTHAREQLTRSAAALEKAQHAIQRNVSRDPEALNTQVRSLLVIHGELITALSGLQDLTKLPDILREAKRVESGLRSLSAKLHGQPGVNETEQLVSLQKEFSGLVQTAEKLAAALHEETLGLERKRTRQTMLHEQQQSLAAERGRLDARIERLDQPPLSKDAAYRQYLEEKQRLDQEIAKLDEKLAAARERITGLNAEEQKKKERLFGLQKHFRDGQQSLAILVNRVNDIRIEMAKLETRERDLEQEMRGELPEASVEEAFTQVAKGTVARDRVESELDEEVTRLKHALELIGGIEEGTTEEFQTTKERFEFLSTQSKDLTKAIGDLEEAITELDATIKKQFQTAFAAIDEKFRGYFRTLFSGGSAKLVLLKEEVLPNEPGNGEDEDDDEEAGAKEAETMKSKTPREKIVTGVEIYATPPGKKLTSIAMLSGGERALTAIALICAIIANNPSPFVVLDEVDAALDEANSQRFAAILQQLASKTQFLVITHNRATMEKAHTLYGVTMGDDGISKLLSVKMEEAEKVIKTHGNR